ncbi:cupin domain-containing protein [Candidatus Pantoea persica]|uniref:cupin domain-containing protein n=1 Tax=Candidatus Pantoea persica TaxID=2518128 RepID=UPI0035A90841|nr:AraC family transcriptional regulator [Candidatus Pantoea persica]
MLMGMRLHSVTYQRIQLAAPFGLRYPHAPGRAQFHFVGRGPLLVRGESGEIFQLNSGDARSAPEQDNRRDASRAGRKLDG